MWFTGHRLPPADVHYVSNDKSCPCQEQAVHAKSGAGNEDGGGPLEPWHIFAHRQHVCGGFTVMQALQENVAGLAYLPFIPHQGRGLGLPTQAHDGDRTAQKVLQR